MSSTAIVTSTEGFGIDARSTGGVITVQGSSGVVSGATDGIYVRSAGGAITIDNIDLVQGLAGDALDLGAAGGDISVTALDQIIGVAGNGILANAAGGDVNIAGNGDVSGSLAGIAAITAGTGTINVDVSGTTIGDAYGIEVSSEGGAATLVNSGTLSGGAFAVFASGDLTGPIAFTNTGIVSEAISFAAADDTFANDALFIANGTSDFGDGTDLLSNSDTISVASAADFLRLEQFNNAGLITLANDTVGGALTTSGDFFGEDSILALDVDFANNAADVFTVDGAASGSTFVAINALNLDANFADDLVLVDAGAGTDPAAFFINEEVFQITEFLGFELVFDAATNDFAFGLGLEPRAFESLKLAEGAQSLWYRSNDAWADHRSNARFADEAASPVWAVMYGAESSRDEQFADPTGIAIVAAGDAVLDYSQDFFGVQTGIEKPLNDALTLGLTGGYLSSRLKLEESATRAEFDVLNIGAALSFESGGLFAEALVKYDDISGVVRDQAIGGFNGDLDGSAIGGRIELGYRTSGSGFYAEPKVSVEYQQTDLDSLAIEGQTFEFDELDGLRGIAGLRLGSVSKLGESSTLGFYLEGSAVHEFEGEGIVRFSSVFDDTQFANDAIGTYGRIEAGVTIDGAGPVSGFFKAESDVSSDFTSFGASAGIRFRF